MSSSPAEGVDQDGPPKEPGPMNNKEPDGSKEDKVSIKSDAATTELKHVNIDPAPEISSDTESGWAAITKSVREVDEQKIQGCKEDIDTILVFAGLYSAVLTALLAESVQALQPDPNAIVITLLTQLVTQTHTYSINSGFLNSTTPPLNINTTTAFQPGLAAKRVNICWFASLTLSLISASFGILVKQWLREHLAGEKVSPQARIRVRDFRKPGLEHWHVFGIAALLPLVLQLALALFFIGLCFFTLNIDSSIGFTTIPLVAGWAFLFIAAAFAPALSPRCPYKVPLFKPIMKVLRDSLFHAFWLFNGLPKLPPKNEWPIRRSSRWSWMSLAYTEDDAAKDRRRDVAILVEVDERNAQGSPSTILDFVLKIINVRLHTNLSAAERLPFMLDLRKLPVQTCTILVDGITDILKRELRRFPASEAIEYSDWMHNCLALLLARLPCLLSDKAIRVVSTCFAGTQSSRSIKTVDEVVNTVDAKDRDALCLHLQERIRYAFMDYNAWQLLDTMYNIVKACCCKCDPHSEDACSTVETVLEQHADTVPSVVAEYTFEVITSYMLHQIKTGAPWSEWHRTITFVLLKKHKDSPKASWHGGLLELRRLLLASPKYAPFLVRHMYHRSDFDQVAETTFAATLPSSPQKQQILENLHHSFTAYLAEMFKIPDLLDQTFYLYLLWFIDGQFPPMQLIIKGQDRGVVLTEYAPYYQLTWKAAHTAFSRFNPQTVTTEQTKWAHTCLEKVDELDTLWLPPKIVGADPEEDFEQWAEKFNPASSYFDDDLIEDFMRFIPGIDEQKDVKYRRVRRKLWLREKITRRPDGNLDNRLVAEVDEAEHADSLPWSIGRLQPEITLPMPYAKPVILGERVEDVDQDAATVNETAPDIARDDQSGDSERARPTRRDSYISYLLGSDKSTESSESDTEADQPARDTGRTSPEDVVP